MDLERICMCFKEQITHTVFPMSRDNDHNQDKSHYFMNMFSYKDNMRGVFFLKKIFVYCKAENSKTKIQIREYTDYYTMTF